jgi:hypothetical protein
VQADALTKIKGGLRGLYRTLELPGKNPLKDAHAELDAAVQSHSVAAPAGLPLVVIRATQKGKERRGFTVDEEGAIRHFLGRGSAAR